MHFPRVWGITWCMPVYVSDRAGAHLLLECLQVSRLCSVNQPTPSSCVFSPSWILMAKDLQWSQHLLKKIIMNRVRGHADFHMHTLLLIFTRGKEIQTKITHFKRKSVESWQERKHVTLIRQLKGCSTRLLLSVVPCMSCTGLVTSVHSVWQAVHLGYWLQSPQGFPLDSICRCAIVSHCIEIWTAGLMAEGPMGGSPHLKHLMDGFSKAVKIVVY